MKNHHGICWLVGLALVGGIFLGGFFIGRNRSAFPIDASVFSPATDPLCTAPVTTAVAGKRININTASAEALQTLPGIGPVLAQKILDYRAKNGPFDTVATLIKVEGISAKRLEAILDYITTGG